MPFKKGGRLLGAALAVVAVCLASFFALTSVSYAQGEGTLAIPGFTQWKGSELSPDCRYIIVAEDPTEGSDDVFALYLSDEGKTQGAGSLNTEGVVSAQLTVADGELSVTHLYDNSELTVDDLLLTVEKNGNAYSFKSEATGNWLHLNNNMTTDVEANKGTFTISQSNGDATIDCVQNNRYLEFNVNGGPGQYSTAKTDFWGPASKQTDYAINIYVYNADMTFGAKPTGTTESQPITSGILSSQKFRIPSMTTLADGSIVAGADVRWNHNADSAGNLDTVVTRSADDGATWSWEVVNYFRDYADNSNRETKSASFIDSALVQGSDGTIYLLSDACPANVGLQAGVCGNTSTGFDQDGNPLLMKGEAGSIASTDASQYTYYVDLAAEKDFTAKSGTVTLRPIKAIEGDVEQGVWVDGDWHLYTVSGESAAPVVCEQYSSSDTQNGVLIHNSVFYRQSEWKLYPTFFISVREGVQGEDGSITWSNELKLLDIKKSGEGFVGVCPGRGLIVPLDNGGERILFHVYDNATGTELASSVYSDDGGQTWCRGERTPEMNGTGKSSESQSVLLPDGTVRLYSRNSIGQISYADSSDGGAAWGTSHADAALAYCGNCMVSFINVPGSVIDAEGEVHGNLIAASYPKGSGRANGVWRL